MNRLCRKQQRSPGKVSLVPVSLRAACYVAQKRGINHYDSAHVRQPKRPLVDHISLASFTKSIFESLQLSEGDAALVSNALVTCNLRGQDGHGVSRIPVYAKRLRSKVVNPKPNIAITDVALAAAHCDGNNGMGFVVATKAMDYAITRARDATGIFMVGVHRSTHFGASAQYVQQALDAGMMSMVFTNSSPALPPWGGAKAFLGASPIAAGAPGGFECPPFLMDMSTTIIARGKLRLAAQRGEHIPPGIGLDRNGKPTTDGMEAFHGVTLPFGGVKGATLSMMMEIFSGLFTGAAFGGRVSSLYNDFSQEQNVGHLIVVMRPDLFVSLDDYRWRMDELMQRTKAQPRAEGFDDILVAGEPETNTAAIRLREGIPIQVDVLQQLKYEATTAGVTFPFDHLL